VSRRTSCTAAIAVVPLTDVAAEKHDLVPWLARVQPAPDDRVVESRPRENVPEFGSVPRG
jgi:hypothetical protein